MRPVISTIEDIQKKGFRTYTGDRPFSPVMTAPARVTLTAAPNLINGKIKLIETEKIKSNPNAM